SSDLRARGALGSHAAAAGPGGGRVRARHRQHAPRLPARVPRRPRGARRARGGRHPDRGERHRRRQRCRHRPDPRPAPGGDRARRHRGHPPRAHQACRARAADPERARHRRRHHRPQGLRMSGATIDPTLYRERDRVPIRRALVAVSDKTGLVELARALADAGVEIVSTGGTSKAIADAGIPVTQIGDLTGFPEHLDGRVRTLHPHVHSGLLADLRLESHERELAEFGIEPFELVVVNLYPFAETVASGAEPDAVIEQIDIGGPAMVRASAKNHANVAVVTSPARYPDVVDALAAGGTTRAQRAELVREAFRHTADYDIAVASWIGNVLAPDDDGSGFPGWAGATWARAEVLRYGENAHQRAALYRDARGAGIAQATQLQGKEMSYNNYVDADAALRAAFDHAGPAVAIIKHANPCGIATAATIAEAHALAHACDPLSAFGGVIAANRVITKEAAESIAPIFTEVVVAPGFAPEALELLQAKKNLRLLELPAGHAHAALELRLISGGLLLQEADTHFADP